MMYVALHPNLKMEHLGYLPEFLSADDPRPAKEQYNENYSHGGGWRPQPGWKWTGTVAQYDGDPDLVPIAMTVLRDEVVLFFEHALVMILQQDGSFEMARMD